RSTDRRPSCSRVTIMVPCYQGTFLSSERGRTRGPTCRSPSGALRVHGRRNFRLRRASDQEVPTAPRAFVACGRVRPGPRFSRERSTTRGASNEHESEPASDLSRPGSRREAGMKPSHMASLGVLTLALAATACGATRGSSGGSGPPAAAPPAKPLASGCGRLHAGGTGTVPLGAARAGSTVALATRDGSTLAYTADEDDWAVHVVDVDARQALGETALEGRPSQLMFLPDGRLAVLLRDRGQIVVMEPGAKPEELEK